MTKEARQTFPNGTVITYTFTKRGTRGPAEAVWHDGPIAARPPKWTERKLPEAGRSCWDQGAGINVRSRGRRRAIFRREGKWPEYKHPPSACRA